MPSCVLVVCHLRVWRRLVLCGLHGGAAAALQFVPLAARLVFTKQGVERSTKLVVCLDRWTAQHANQEEVVLP